MDPENPNNGQLPANSKAKRGRKPWIPPDSRQIEELAAIGLTEKEISLCLGISTETLYQKKKCFPDFSDAIDRGRAQGIKKRAEVLIKEADKGNIQALIFYLKARAGWNDQHVEISGKGGGPITLAALRDAFAKEIDED